MAEGDEEATRELGRRRSGPSEDTALDLVTDVARLAREPHSLTQDLSGRSRHLTKLGDATAEGADAVLAEVRQSVADRLETIRDHARGGMGVVQLAADRALQRRLAKKVLHDELRDDPRALRLFLREARITAQLEHPNIVPVHEIGEDDDGRLFFTMRLVEGRTLSDRIRDLDERPPRGEALLDLLDIVIRVCEALSFAHSRGVLHCDIKPANVMIGDYGEVYLMDWGIARILGGAGRSGTGTISPATDDGTDRVIMGTAAYMSPEQALGLRDELDERADVFSTGALLYQVLVGRPPYAARSASVALDRARRVDMRPIADALETPPPRELVRIVERALSPLRDDRHPTVDALRGDLVRYLRGIDDFPTRSFAPGEAMMREGDLGERAYIIVSGGVEVTRGEGEARAVLQTLGPGEVVGETAVLTRSVRNADVTATMPTTVRVLDRARLEQEIDAMKPWMGSLLRTVAKRFRDA